jgi:predicted nucleic acid-binding protein
MHAVAEKTITAPGTAWHCCLEFFSVATRLPPEFRLSPTDAVHLVDHEIFARMTVHDLPAADRVAMLNAAAQDGTAGGRIYDTHIAEVARAAGARVVVTDNRRHFLAALRHGIRVETPTEFLAGLKAKRDR